MGRVYTDGALEKGGIQITGDGSGQRARMGEASRELAVAMSVWHFLA